MLGIVAQASSFAHLWIFRHAAAISCISSSSPSNAGCGIHTLSHAA